MKKYSRKEIYWLRKKKIKKSQFVRIERGQQVNWERSQWYLH